MWRSSSTRQGRWETSRGSGAACRQTFPERNRGPARCRRGDRQPIYTGVCGSDTSIWFRTSFRDLIYDSLDARGNDTGPRTRAARRGGAGGSWRRRITTSNRRHRFGGIAHCLRQMHQCLIGQTNVCADERILGNSTDGVFAEYSSCRVVLWRTDTRRYAGKSARYRTVGNAVHACTTVDLRGKNVVIFGVGAIASSRS